MNRTFLRIATITFASLAGLAFTTPSAQALADLQITNMSVVGQARLGTCNRVSFTVRNQGDTFTGNATLDLFLATYPNGSPTQNRAEKNFFISPMQGGAQVTFTINDVEFKATGGTTLQALVDSTQETQESNENNNTRNLNANVSGACPGIAPPPPTNGGNPPGCDIEATYAAPNGSSVPSSQSYTYEIRFKNVGSAPCGAFKINLSRHNGRRCSGYGSRIGGSRAWASVPGLQPGASTIARISERRTPSSGTVCIKPGFSPHSFKDDNNNNHRREKVVTYQ